MDVALILITIGTLVMTAHLFLSAAEHKNIKARLFLAADNHSKLMLLEEIGLVFLFGGLAIAFFL